MLLFIFHMYFIFRELFILTLCLTDIPNCHLPPNTNLDDIKWAIFSLPNLSSLQHWTQVTIPSWESESETMPSILSCFLKFLFQHFLFCWTIKCWGPWGLISRPSSVFPILFLWVIFSSLMISNIIYIYSPKFLSHPYFCSNFQADT